MQAPARPPDPPPPPPLSADPGLSRGGAEAGGAGVLVRMPKMLVFKKRSPFFVHFTSKTPWPFLHPKPRPGRSGPCILPA